MPWGLWQTSHNHILTTPHEEFPTNQNSAQRKYQDGGLQIEGLRRIQVNNTRGNQGPNSLVTQRNTKFFLTLQNNEHFLHFLAPSFSLSGSAGVLLFACYSGSTGTLTRVRPHHGLNKDKEARQVIIIGIQILLCEGIAYTDFDLTATVFLILDLSYEKICCYGRRGFHNKTLPLNVAAESLKCQYKFSLSPQRFNLMLSNKVES